MDDDILPCLAGRALYGQAVDQNHYLHTSSLFEIL
jgi:hypothetical protein